MIKEQIKEMSTKKILLLTGWFFIVFGILILLGLDLPDRTGKIIMNPVNYAIKTMLFGVIILLATKIYVKGEGQK